MFSWVEIYSCFSYDEFLKAQNMLIYRDIPIKEKVYSTRERMANNIILGGRPDILNTGGMRSPNQQYIIFTKKGYVREARALLGKMKKWLPPVYAIYAAIPLLTPNGISHVVGFHL